MPSTARDTAIIFKMGHMIVVGLPMLRIRRQNLAVELEPPRATRARDKVTQRVASSGCIQSLIEGIRHPQASYLSLDWEVSFMPPVWAGIELSGFRSQGLPEKDT
jgi:hypothetical protein